MPSPDPERVQLDALRTLIKLAPGQFVFSLKREEEGFSLHFRGHDARSKRRTFWLDGVLMAEKSQQVRIFARAETAFRLLESLGVKSVTVGLGQVRPDSSVAN